jgi:predicted amidohydrolase
MLVPWPLRVAARAFRPIEGPIENMDRSRFGFFEFAPDEALDLDLLTRLVHSALRTANRIDAVVLPEAAIDVSELEGIERTLAAVQVPLLITGVREAASAGELGRNYVHIGVLGSGGWERYRQAKHHRWCLDEGQIRQYHLSRSLEPSKQWWEAIDLPARAVQIVDLGSGMVLAPLVCEDLARVDEVADLLRRIGPSLVVTPLLDGPQLASRWSCRYATVLADEPQSAVLTLTALGMASRSKPPGKAASRVVAMWSDPATGRHELELARGASAMLITATIDMTTAWTADGRRHERNTPSIVLSEIEQLRAPSGALPSS